MNKSKKNNVVSFPSNISEIEREVEAILFAAAEPLDIESIESRISKILESRILKNHRILEPRFRPGPLQ